MKNLLRKSALVLSLLWHICLQAQTCLPGDEAPGPYLCWPTIAGVSGTTAGYTGDLRPPTFCGTVENNSWFSFSPCQSQVTFSIISNNCTEGKGLEAAIFDQSMLLVSNCYSSGGLNIGGGTVTANGLVPGEIYYFMVDGYEGDECDYILTGTEGLNPPGTPEFNNQPGYIVGEFEICDGAVTTYTAVPPSCNIVAAGYACPLPDLSAYYDTIYHWTVPPGATIIGNGSGAQVTVRWDEVSLGTISAEIEVLSLTGSCPECVGGMPDFACGQGIAPLSVTKRPTIYTHLPPVNLCEGECFETGNYTYCTPGRYEQSFVSAGGCDSIVIVNISTSKNVVNQLPDKFICPGECVTEAGQMFCNEGSFEIYLNTDAGCDSLLMFDVVELDEYSERLPLMSLCEGSCFEIGGQEFCESGRYQVYLQTAAGCDSIVHFDLEMLKHSKNILPPVEICENDCYEFEGQMICEPGTFEFYRINDAGCDSIVVLEVVQNQSNKTSLPRITLCEGETFEIGGEIFDEGGINNVVLENKFGCDSTVYFDIKYRAIDVEIPDKILLTPENSSTRILPEIIGDWSDLEFEWSGFPYSTRMLAQYINTPGTYTLTVTDTVVGCSVSKTVEVFQLFRECQRDLFISPSSHCQSAPFLCGEFLDGFCTYTDGFSQFSLTGNIREVITDSLENPRWLRWSPCSETATFRVGVKKSEQQKGIELSVLKTDDCESYVPILNSAKIAATSVETIEVNGLVPGEVYRFLFDGIDGDICDFQIEIIDGVSKEPVEWEMVTPAQILGEPGFCPGIPQKFEMIPPVCRVKNGNCAFAGELMILQPRRIDWKLPYAATVVGDLNSNVIEVVFEEDKLLPRGADYLPSGTLLSDFITVEISSNLLLPDAVICTNEDSCLFTQTIPVEVNHTLEVLPDVDVCKTAGYEFCGEVVEESDLKICRQSCKTTVQKVTVREAYEVDHGFVRICPGTCYTLPFSKREICDPGTYVFPISEKCGGTEMITIGFYDKEVITAGPITEICHPLHTSYKVSFDILEGVPPYLVDGEPISRGRFVSGDIPTGEPYIFRITDESVCNVEAFVEGRYDCGPLCSSLAGSMSSLILDVCENEPAMPVHDANYNLDSDDGLEFVLHTSPSDSLGQIIDRKTAGGFMFQKGVMEYNRIYYASAVVGTMLDGEVDLSDRCLSVAPGQPVIFKKSPSIHLKDQIVLDCSNPSVVLSAEAVSSTPFNWSLPDGTSTADETLEISSPGVYSFYARGANGCSFSKTFTVSENKELPAADAGEPKMLHCEQEFVKLEANVDAGSNFSYKWSTGEGAIKGANNKQIVKAAAPGIYFLEIKDNNNGCEKTDSVSVSKNDEPTHRVFYEITSPTCYDLDDGIVKIENVTGGFPPFQYSFDGADFSGLESFRYLRSGVYQVLVRDAYGCISEDVLTVEEPREVVVNLGDDQFITLGDRVRLTAAMSIDPAKIEWWSSLGVEFWGADQWEVRPPETSTYFVRIYDENDCFAEDRVNLIVKESAVYIPSGFSPNNDKKNDFFTVYAGESVKQILSLRVYNRRGAVVFEKNNFPPNIESAGWSGYSAGKRNHADVYVYVADVEFINGDVRTFRGDITLVR